ncbi:hypothetical protein ABH935_002700 [Catenulispora sp. GAS73]|uniref:hypothetical protein n=1 Tax=Catenulispora sp. GAS73 TaxID=3156269 RepID=UPI0035180720
MTGRARVAVWTGSGLLVAGSAVAVVAWVGLDKANQYLGVPAAIAALLGLVVAVYGLVAPKPSPSVTQVIEDLGVVGSSVVIGRAGNVRIGASSPQAAVPAVPAAPLPGPVVDASTSQAVHRMTARDSTIIGQADGDVEISNGP